VRPASTSWKFGGADGDRPVSRAYIQLEFINSTGTVSLDDIVLYRDAYRIDIGNQEDWNTALMPHSSSQQSGPALVTPTSTLKVVYLPDSQLISVPGFGTAIAIAALSLVLFFTRRRRH
jgi:PGF-CTERM protein